jgi:hypothetical protein
VLNVVDTDYKQYAITVSCSKKTAKQREYLHCYYIYEYVSLENPQNSEGIALPVIRNEEDTILSRGHNRTPLLQAKNFSASVIMYFLN